MTDVLTQDGHRYVEYIPAEPVAHVICSVCCRTLAKVTAGGGKSLIENWKAHPSWRGRRHVCVGCYEGEPEANVSNDVSGRSEADER